MINIPQPKELATIRVASGGAPLWAIAILLIVMAVPGWYVGHYWTGKPFGRKEVLTEIAAKNKPVRDIMEQGDRDAEIIETEAIEEIGGQNDLLTAREKELKYLRAKPRIVISQPANDPEPDTCPAIPARCVLP